MNGTIEEKKEHDQQVRSLALSELLYSWVYHIQITLKHPL